MPFLGPALENEVWILGPALENEVWILGPALENEVWILGPALEINNWILGPALESKYCFLGLALEFSRVDCKHVEMAEELRNFTLISSQGNPITSGGSSSCALGL